MMGTRAGWPYSGANHISLHRWFRPRVVDGVEGHVMDGERFDAIAKGLSAGTPRRLLLGGLLGMGLAGLLREPVSEARAKKRGRKHKKKRCTKTNRTCTPNQAKKCCSKQCGCVSIPERPEERTCTCRRPANRCRQLGQSCTTTKDCCEGPCACSGGTCTCRAAICQQQAGPCEQDQQCCAGSCDPVGDVCTS